MSFLFTKYIRVKDEVNKSCVDELVERADIVDEVIGEINFCEGWKIFDFGYVPYLVTL